jgi:hypothetical protein
MKSKNLSKQCAKSRTLKWKLEEMRCILVFCRKCPQWTILYHVKLKLFTTVIAVFSKQIRYIFTSTEQVSTMSPPVVINSFQNKIVTIQHANQSIIILTQCTLHQLVHTLTGCTFMYFKIFLQRISTRRHRYLLIYQVTRQAS